MEDKILNLLKKYKVRFRYIELSDDKVIIGAEGTKTRNLELLRKIKLLGLTPINITYGRWLFHVNNY